MNRVLAPVVERACHEIMLEDGYSDSAAAVPETGDEGSVPA